MLQIFLGLAQPAMPAFADGVNLKWTVRSEAIQADNAGTQSADSRSYSGLLDVRC